MRNTDDKLRELVYRSCLALDALDFAGYLGLCGDQMRYQIINYSPEIRKDVILMNLDRDGLAALFESLPHHITLPGTLLRHASVYLIERQRNGTVALLTSSLLVVQTDADGLSRIFAAGRYHDTVDITQPVPNLISRTARLETRDIGIGCEVPL